MHPATSTHAPNPPPNLTAAAAGTASVIACSGVGYSRRSGALTPTAGG